MSTIEINPGDELLTKLAETMEIHFGEFEGISAGRKSKTPFLINTRTVFGHPSTFRMLKRCLAEGALKFKEQPEQFVGISYSGVPLAVAIADANSCAFSYYRKEQKKDALKNFHEGVDPAGKHAVLVDDTVVKGVKTERLYRNLLTLKPKSISLLTVFRLCTAFILQCK